MPKALQTTVPVISFSVDSPSPILTVEDLLGVGHLSYHIHALRGFGYLIDLASCSATQALKISSPQMRIQPAIRPLFPTSTYISKLKYVSVFLEHKMRVPYNFTIFIPDTPSTLFSFAAHCYTTPACCKLWA